MTSIFCMHCFIAVKLPGDRTFSFSQAQTKSAITTRDYSIILKSAIHTRGYSIFLYF